MPERWRWPAWHRDDEGRTSRVEVPEAGGWLYKFRDDTGLSSHVFVPDLQVWADVIAASIAASKEAAVSVDLDLTAATHQTQPAPPRKRK